jgi:inosine-uridine nucleoside N-ribohydrolase
LPPSPRAPVPTTAAQLIIDTVLAQPGEITVVLLGPFTNMALAMLLRPDLTDHVAEIVVMGGAAFAPGNASPAAEANILNDPEAADIVFGASCPITMAGLDVTHRVLMTSADIARFATVDTAQGRHLAAILPFYAEFYRTRAGLDGIFVHDSTTISYLLAPDVFTWCELPIRVDVGNSVGRGRTVAAHRDSDQEGPWHGRRAVRILTDVDARAVIDLEFARLQRS